MHVEHAATRASSNVQNLQKTSVSASKIDTRSGPERVRARKIEVLRATFARKTQQERAKPSKILKIGATEPVEREKVELRVD